MSTWRDLRDLLEMYGAGGLVVMTGMNGEVMETAVPSPLSEYKGKIYDAAGIRTTIQLDSDYVTVMVPAVLRQPHIWQSHVAHVEAKLAVLGKLRSWARHSWLLFMLIPLAWYGYDLSRLNSWAEAWRLVYPTLLSTAIVLSRKWILRGLQTAALPLLMRMVVWFAQRQRDRADGGRGKRPPA